MVNLIDRSELRPRLKPLSAILNHTLDDAIGSEWKTIYSGDLLKLDTGKQVKAYQGPGFYWICDLLDGASGKFVRLSRTEKGKLINWYPTPLEDIQDALDDTMTYLNQEPTEHEDHREHVLVDFGCSDFRAGLVANAAYGMRTIGVDIDEFMIDMAKKNIRESARQYGASLADQAQVVKGSFFDQQLLSDVFSPARTYPNQRYLVFMYLGKITRPAVRQVLPHLQPGDYVITYNMALSQKQRLPRSLSGKLEIKQEPGYINPNYGIYRVR